MAFSFDAWLAKVDASIRSNNLESALADVCNFVAHLSRIEKSFGRVFSSPELDSACYRIGTALFSTGPHCDSSTAKVRVYVGSDFLPYGGHTPALGDVMRAAPEMQHVVLTTNLLPHSADAQRFRALFPPELKVEVRCAPRGSLLNQAIWVRNNIVSIAPESVTLFTHHFDGVAIVACCPSLGIPVYFYHHADFSLCLGVHVPCFLHVDGNPIVYEHCRDELGVKVDKYWPVVCAARPRTKEPDRFLVDGLLRTASSGSSHKFERPRRHDYRAIVRDLLVATRGIHFHIGPLSDNFVSDVRRVISASGLPADRFVHVPHVDSVWDFFVVNDIDVLLGSFPLGGPKTMIEAMGAGLPLLVPKAYEPYRGMAASDMAYPGKFTWSSVDELVDIVKSIQKEDLVRHSAASRAHYLANHTIEVLAREVNRRPGDPGMRPLPLETHHIDFLRVYLDQEGVEP